MSHPKEVKYLKPWNPDLIILYYTTAFTPIVDPIARYNFLPKKMRKIMKIPN
jgi:hypothetical protein